MQFLADESCDSSIVRVLRELGHDVTYVPEFAAGEKDKNILALAYEQERVVVTEDRDFCELVFRDGKPTFGIILVRIAVIHRSTKTSRITTLMTLHADQLAHAMTTVTLNKIGIRPLPTED